MNFIEARSNIATMCRKKVIEIMKKDDIDKYEKLRLTNILFKDSEDMCDRLDEMAIEYYILRDKLKLESDK